MSALRFYHLADLHLGHSTYQRLRRDGYALLHELNDRARADGVRLLLLAGDIFDRPPTTEALTRLYTILSDFPGRAFFIPSNHDHVAPNSAYKTVTAPENVKVFTSPEIRSFDWPEENLTVWGFAYDQEQICNHRYEEIVLPDDARRHILLAHGGDALHVPTDYKAISDFTYVAFGHFHRYQVISERIVYSGAPYPMDITEGGVHGYVKGEIADDGSVSHQLVALSSAYAPISVDISDCHNVEDIYRLLKEETAGAEQANVTLTGHRNFDLRPHLPHLHQAGDIASLKNATTVHYDYDALKKHHANDLLGLFIEAMQNDTSPLAERALEFGVRAFLEGDDDAHS